MEEDPSKSRPGSSRLEDGSDSGSALSSPQEKMDPCSLQEHILNLTEDEWRVFSSMLHTPMTRMQFAEICMAVMKVVSLSSITVIVPAYVGVAKDVRTSRQTTPTTISVITSTERSYHSSKDTSPETESASTSSPELPGGPVSDLVHRMKGVLASLRKTVYPPAEDSESSASERTASTKATSETHGDAAHDLACITTILDRLVASGRVHQIAKNLVSQVQGAMRDSAPATVPLAAGKSVSDSVLSAKVKAAPRRTLSASNMVYTYAEEAIRNLLQPYFLPLVAWSDASSRPRSATTEGPSPSLLGLERDECSCLMSQLMQRLPADISLREPVGSARPSSALQGRVTVSPSQGFSEVADLFTRVMTSQVMDMIDSELKRHEQARLPSPDHEVSAIEGPMSDMVPGWYGGLFSGLIQRFLSEFLPTESVLSDGVSGTPSPPMSLSTHISTASPVVELAPQDLENMLGLFTRVMLSQVLDIIQLESPGTLVSPIAELRPYSATSRPSSALYSILGSDFFTDGTSVASAASRDNGCLVTALVLRLLVKLRDQSTSSPDTVESSRELIGQILSEFSSATGTPDFQTYPNNVKIQAIYRAVDKFLLKEFGPETVLQRAVDTQDESFDTILLSCLRKELLPRCDAEVIAVPSPQSSPALTATPSAPSASLSLGPVQGAASRETPRRWFNIKMPRLCRKKVFPSNAVSDSIGERVETPACDTPSVSTSSQRPRKNNFFRGIFTCCFRGSFEH